MYLYIYVHYKSLAVNRCGPVQNGQCEKSCEVQKISYICCPMLYI